MTSLKLIEATKHNVNPLSELACYHCLREFDGREVEEYTGGLCALAICPKCSVDSVIIKSEDFTRSRLMAAHVKGFHFACGVTKDGDLEPDELITCGRKSCYTWDKFVKEVGE